MPTPPAKVFVNKLNAAHKIFRLVLGDATPDSAFRVRAFTISVDGNWLYEYTGNGLVVAEAVLGADFPREKGPIELHHYAALSTLQAIVTSKQIHLYPITKRIHENEFSTFAHEHDLKGYFEQNDRGKALFEELSNDLFYTSLTKLGNPDEDRLWNDFADQERGVRIQLRVTPKAPADLRQMAYQTGNSTALKRINESLLSEEGMIYIPWTLSRICAFYLPRGYQSEREVRLMVKRHVGGLDKTITSGNYKVWPIALAQPGATTDDPCCEIEMVEVAAGRSCSKETVQSILASSVFSAVPVT